VDPNPDWKSVSGSRRAKRPTKVEKNKEISYFEVKVALF
jgi:hypothetical protein